MRSLFSNYELLNFISGDIVSELDDIFDEYKSYSTLLPPRIKNKKSVFKVFIIKLIAPLM
jgi:hypothetical protein